MDENCVYCRYYEWDEETQCYDCMCRKVNWDEEGNCSQYQEADDEYYAMKYYGLV